MTFAQEDASGFPITSHFRGFAPDGEAVVSATEKQGQEYVERFFLYPSGAPLVAPRAAGRATPQGDPDVGVGWLNWDPGNGYYDSDGKLLVPGGGGKRLVRVLAQGDSKRLAFWVGSGEQIFTGLYDGTGKLVKVLVWKGFLDLDGQLPNGQLYGTIGLPGPFGFGLDGGSAACKQESGAYYASLIDWNRGTIHPVHELGDCPPGQGHGFFQAIVPRAALRVATDGDCLNVRKEPSTSAESIGCFADGVLLGVRGDGASPVAPGWRAVVTPGLEAGWAAEEFLQP